MFDGNLRRVNDYAGDCGCTGGLRDNVFWTVDGGADRLEGQGGDDSYYLGVGTGHDRIEEQWRDSDWGGDVYFLGRGSGREAVNEGNCDTAGDFYQENQIFGGKKGLTMPFSVLQYTYYAC